MILCGRRVMELQLVANLQDYGVQVQPCGVDVRSGALPGTHQLGR
jgi:hypothetical protein